jgi:hypothetical protein
LGVQQRAQREGASSNSNTTSSSSSSSSISWNHALNKYADAQPHARCAQLLLCLLLLRRRFVRCVKVVCCQQEAYADANKVLFSKRLRVLKVRGGHMQSMPPRRSAGVSAGSMQCQGASSSAPGRALATACHTFHQQQLLSCYASHTLSNRSSSTCCDLSYCPCLCLLCVYCAVLCCHLFSIDHRG